MKKINIFILSLMTTFAWGQTTYDVNWQVGISVPDASFTIEQGDTMRWTWIDAVPHSVTSDSGSQESFDSGILTGVGTEFSFTFTQVGTNAYGCDVHSNMEGTITVEAPLSIEDKFALNLHFYPNPVEDQLTIVSLYQIDAYAIYDVTGRNVTQGAGNGTITQLGTGHLEAGMYFVTVASGEQRATVQVMKK